MRLLGGEQDEDLACQSRRVSWSTHRHFCHGWVFQSVSFFDCCLDHDNSRFDRPESGNSPRFPGQKEISQKGFRDFGSVAFPAWVVG